MALHGHKVRALCDLAPFHSMLKGRTYDEPDKEKYPHTEEQDVLRLHSGLNSRNSTFSPNPASGAPTATGTFSFTPTAGQSGQTFNISFSASDNQGCSGAVQFSVTVGESQPGPVANHCGNHAPVISVPSMPMIGLGQTLKFAVRATDQDGDNVVVSAYSLPVGAAFDLASGSFTFTPTDSGVDMYRTKLGQSAEAIFLARDSNGAATMAGSTFAL